MRVKIKQRIERMGMTVADVADLTGVKRQYLYRVISGATTPSVKYVLKLCTVLKCIVEDLFELELKDTYKFLVCLIYVAAMNILISCHNIYYATQFKTHLLHFQSKHTLKINQSVFFSGLCKPNLGGVYA